MNKEGEKIYEGIEDQDCCSCSGAHGDITILDNYESEVMHLHRGLICTKICFPCCYEAVQVRIQVPKRKTILRRVI